MFSDENIVSMTACIIGSWALVVSFGFFALAIKNLQLPSYQDEFLVTTVDTKNKEDEDKKSKILDGTLILCGAFLVFFTASIDILFQSQIYIFGLCGPLKLTAQHAGMLNSAYFVSILIGRIMAIPLSMVITSSIMILCSCLGCLVFGIILITMGTHNIIALFTSTCFIGFHVCFFIGSIINWLTSEIKNMNSKHVSFIFLGSPLANCIIPPLASRLFYSKGPIFVFYTIILCVILLFSCFIVMNVLAKYKKK